MCGAFAVSWSLWLWQPDAIVRAAPTSPAPPSVIDDADPADDAVPGPPARCGGAPLAQCRAEFADFIVPRNTIPASYAGPWFQPNLIEQAHTGVPSGTRPWRAFDPRQESQRLAYLLAPRNYAFGSEQVRALTPSLTADTDYFDAAGGTVLILQSRTPR